jgi:Zn-dependent protease
MEPARAPKDGCLELSSELEWPAVVDGIAVHALFPDRADTPWIIGSRESDSFLVLPRRVLGPVQRAVLLMDGTRSLPAIQLLLEAEYGRSLDLDHLCTCLHAAGLLRTGSTTAGNRPTDVDRSSLHLFTANLRPITNWVQQHAADLPRIWVTAMIFVAGAALGVILISGPPAAPTAALPAGVFLITCILSVLLHELGHGVAAMRQGIVPQAVTASLYLGFIPIFYLRLPGLYLLSRGGRVRVWLAGCATNAVIGLTAVALVHSLPRDSTAAAVFAACARWNFALIALNLFPLLPTDGYFLASTALGEHNLRRRAWLALGSWLRGRWIRVPWPVTTYLLGSLALLSLFGYKAARWEVGEDPTVPALKLGIIALAFVAATVGWGHVLSRHLSSAWRRIQIILTKTTRELSRRLVSRRDERLKVQERVRAQGL